MELFQEGGLEQDGGTTDPVSGNEVPIGSAKEEVRDDIDARLSEGEFVFPADVVRFIGLEKLMMLRQNAKAGLKKMEAMGQMGNSEEATLPDDIPFSSDDLIVGDDAGKDGDLEMQVGGFVPPFGTQQQQGTGIYTQASQMGGQFTVQPQQTMQPSAMVSQQPVATGYGPNFIGGQQPTTDFKKLVPMPTQSYENIRFVNAAGEIMIIPHTNGNPVFPVPEGYTRETADTSQVKKDTEETLESPTDVKVKTATVTKPDPNLQRDPQREREEAEAQEQATNRSYDNMFKLAYEQSPDKSLEGVTKFIKDGNVKADVPIFGEIKIPGFTFEEAKIEEAYNRNFLGYDDTYETDVKSMIETVKDPVTGGSKIVTDDKDKIIAQTQSKKAKQEAKDQADAIKFRKEQEAKIYQSVLDDRRKQEAEDRRKKEKEERAFKDFKESQKKVSGYAPDFKKGGIATKAKKKVMKQGGLASKK